MSPPLPRPSIRRMESETPGGAVPRRRDQRYVSHLPAAGEIVFFDRSWYNRAGVERVMGFTSSAQVDLFFDQVTAFERHLVESGIRLRARLEAIRHVLHAVPYAPRDGSSVREPDPRVVQPAAALFVPAGGSTG